MDEKNIFCILQAEIKLFPKKKRLQTQSNKKIAV